MATRRSTRNLNDEQSEPEANELLSAICLKLDNINDSLQLIIKNQQNDQNSKENQYGVIASSIQDIQNNVSISMKKSVEAESKAAIFRSRKRIIDTWKRHLNKRKQLYWHSLNSDNTAVIYETWLNNEKQIVPKKFQMKEIPNEDPNEKDIRKETVINEFQAEIQLLKIRAERHKSNYTKVEEEMAKFLQNKFNGNELAELKKLWDEDIANEEAKSQSKWQSKQEWLEKYEQQFDNEDLVKPRSDAKPKNSSTRRQHNARHNNEHKTTRGKHHVPTQSEFPRSVNPHETTNNVRRPLNNQPRNPAARASHQSNQRHDTPNTRNPTTHSPHQSSQRYTTRSSHQTSQRYDTPNTRNPTTRASHQSNQHYDAPNTRNEHTEQSRENSATIPLTYSDVIRQSHFENPPPQPQWPMYSFQRGPHFLGMSSYHLNDPPNLTRQQKIFNEQQK